MNHIRFIVVYLLFFIFITACATGRQSIVSTTPPSPQKSEKPVAETETPKISTQNTEKKTLPQHSVANQIEATLKPADTTLPKGPETYEPEDEITTPTADPPPPAAGKHEAGTDQTVAKDPETTLEEALDFSQAAQDFWQKGELDSAIEALDQAYLLILNVDVGHRPKLAQQKEDIRFMISKRILEIYASRHIVVNGNYNAIPLTFNPSVLRQIKKFSVGREKDFFRRSYHRSGKYRAYIVNEFKKAGLPVELSWLPLIESGFKVNAFSKARALGLWQFISSTGYKFGLKRTKYIDERLDYVKSTRAAIAYLKELHNIFGDWTTVLAAYNSGENRVLRVIRNQNINYLDNFWDLYKRLPRETAQYVPRFLATLHMVRNPKKFGLDPATIAPPLKHETVIISRQAHLKQIANKIGISEKILRELNSELRYRIVPPSQYALRVPPGFGELLLARIDQITPTGDPSPAYTTHKIRRGETLGTIARRYRTSISSIAIANNIPKRKYKSIRAGKRLKIPQKGIIYQPKPARTPASTQIFFHTVKRGDSLWKLAKQYNTTTRKIQKLNKLSKTQLHVGQRLKITDKNQKPSTVGLRTYLVKRGDTPFKIAKEYRMPLERLLQLNGLSPRSKIYPNQQLYIH